MGIEVVEARPPGGGADGAVAEPAVERARAGGEGAREGGAVMEFCGGDLVGALEVGFECVEVVGDVFAGAVVLFSVLGL